MYVKEGKHFPGKQKSDSKTKDMFDNLQQKLFSKASHKHIFFGEIYQNIPTMMHTWKPP